MNTSRILRSLCTAAYPLVCLGAVAAAALSLSASPAHARMMWADNTPATRSSGHDAVITPQAIRAPELPVGCVV
ncbi:MAG TPA: hypothetical protein VIO33_05970 [Burkholderiaceae bacterium]